MSLLASPFCPHPKHDPICLPLDISSSLFLEQNNHVGVRSRTGPEPRFLKIRASNEYGEFDKVRTTFTEGWPPRFRNVRHGVEAQLLFSVATKFPVERRAAVCRAQFGVAIYPRLNRASSPNFPRVSRKFEQFFSTITWNFL